MNIIRVFEVKTGSALFSRNPEDKYVWIHDTGQQPVRRMKGIPPVSN